MVFNPSAVESGAALHDYALRFYVERIENNEDKDI